jgi:hypothetical protein
MSDKTIYRVASRHRPYSQLGNAMMRDKRLSFEARGVLCFILSYPDNWEFNIDWIKREQGIGRDRVRRIINELIACGYCGRERGRNNNGTLGSYAYVFTDEPEVKAQDVVGPRPEKASVAKPAKKRTTDGKPVTGEPATAKPPSIRKNDLPKKITNPPSGERSGSENSELDERRGAPARLASYVSEEALDRVRQVAPGWDRQALLRRFLEWPGSREARDMDRAFLGWVKSFTKGKRP